MAKVAVSRQMFADILRTIVSPACGHRPCRMTVTSVQIYRLHIRGRLYERQRSGPLARKAERLARFVAVTYHRSGLHANFGCATDPPRDADHFQLRSGSGGLSVKSQPVSVSPLCLSRSQRTDGYRLSVILDPGRAKLISRTVYDRKLRCF